MANKKTATEVASTIKKGKKVQFDINEGTPYKNKDGEQKMYLNAEQKARKYCVELSTGRDVYNDKILTKGQKAFRSGWLAKRKQNASLHNYATKQEDLKKNDEIF